MKTGYRLAYALLGAFMLLVYGFWGWELRQSLGELERRQEQVVASHQEQLLERKGEQLRDLFHEMYQTARTVSLLPMIRDVRGPNRRSTNEDALAQGRLSADTHRTLQQIYTNLSNAISISEIYYVLDGFDPERDVPFFMYDDLIAGIRGDPAAASAAEDRPEETEEFEYRHFPVQLAWFRENAPRFRWANALNDIPVRLSPLLRTCDNSQYSSLKHGDPREALGLVFAMPVYAATNQRFKGMITIILRANVLEARLAGVPFLPITPADQARQLSEGWRMPDPVAFRLEQPEYGIVIRDRRHPLSDLSPDRLPPDSRLAKQRVDLDSGRPWNLSHVLSAAEISRIAAPVQDERRRVLLGRLALFALLTGIFAWAMLMFWRSRQELTTLAHFDTLTALPNRRLFFEHLQQAIARARRSQRKVALLFIDITDFKAINDAHGHRRGDILLVGIAQRLQEALRDTDRVGRLQAEPAPWRASASRLGGDEFIVICEDIQAADDVAPVASRLIGVLRQPFHLDQDRVEISPSMGVAVYPDDAGDSDKLLVCADSAMHECRRQGGHYFIFNDELRQRSERQNQLSVELSMALERRQFQLFYQPKASLRDGRIVSLEALLRWHHPELGTISPAEFIPILERNGGIVPVGEWVIEQVCRDLARLAGAGYPELKVSANVSVRQLRRGDFHESVAAILERNGTGPHQLILEITESVVMEDLEQGGQVLLRLEAIGTPLAIDDFGTGYSSLTYLQHMPLDYLKLDKGFIAGMTSPRAKHIVETVIHLARGLSLTTIAEGIETVEQREALATLGCDIMQGYLLSKPRPLEEIIDWLAERDRTAG